jgi:hypothetical protein
MFRFFVRLTHRFHGSVKAELQNHPALPIYFERQCPLFRTIEPLFRMRISPLFIGATFYLSYR